MIDHEQNLKSNSNDQQDQTCKPSSKKTLTDAEILSQSLLFMAAGYETIATSLCFTAYNLAISYECQKKLIDEIDRVIEKHVCINETPKQLFYFFKVIFIKKIIEW
jgi:cytochrome P450